MARALLILAALGLLAGYGGALHPAGDSLAVLRPALIAAVLLIAPFCGKGWAPAGLALATFAAAPILWDLRPRPPSSDGLLVYQKNLNFRLADPAPVIADIRASGADLVLLEEVSRRNLAVPAGLADTHPHQLVCKAHSVGAVAILSRWPFTAPELCDTGTGMAAVGVAAPQGPVTVAVLHLHWPWPYGQAAHLDRLMPALNALPQPVVVGGDFNMVPWSHTLRRVTQATGTARVGPLATSFTLKGVYPLTIDHVLAPEGWQARAETRPRLGSDHKAVLARILPRL